VPKLRHHTEVVTHRDVLGAQAVAEPENGAVTDRERAPGRRERDRPAARREHRERPVCVPRIHTCAIARSPSAAISITSNLNPEKAVRARRTHQALVTAARELFAEAGYAATTIEMLARRAGTGRATVFTSVPGGKPQLLKEARDQAIAGDDEPVPIPQRSWFVDAMAQTDPRELLRRQAANYRRIHERAARLEQALATAAATDPALAELDAEARRQRHLGAGFVARRLGELGALADPETAPDTIYALASPGVYLLLTGDRGWPPGRYQDWLADRLAGSLLNPDRV
jgi:AcrR family transcriptional regulator